LRGVFAFKKAPPTSLSPPHPPTPFEAFASASGAFCITAPPPHPPHPPTPLFFLVLVFLPPSPLQVLRPPSLVVCHHGVYRADVGVWRRDLLFEAHRLLAPADEHHRANSHAEQYDSHGDANRGAQREASGTRRLPARRTSNGQRQTKISFRRNLVCYRMASSHSRCSAHNRPVYHEGEPHVRWATLG
jgi:hypothetical protein